MHLTIEKLSQLGTVAHRGLRLTRSHSRNLLDLSQSTLLWSNFTKESNRNKLAKRSQKYSANILDMDMEVFLLKPAFNLSNSSYKWTVFRTYLRRFTMSHVNEGDIMPLSKVQALQEANTLVVQFQARGIDMHWYQMIKKTQKLPSYTRRCHALISKAPTLASTGSDSSRNKDLPRNPPKDKREWINESPISQGFFITAWFGRFKKKICTPRN